MAAFFAIPVEARRVCGSSAGRRALLFYLYERADARRWGAIAFTDRELAEASGLSRHAVWSALDDLEQEGLAAIVRAPSGTKERSTVTMTSPVRNAEAEPGQNSGQKPARTPARTDEGQPMEDGNSGQNSGQKPARSPATRVENTRARSDPRTQTTEPRQVLSPSERVERDPLPLWARKASVPAGTSRSLLVQVVMDVRNEVLGTMGSPDSCGTASKAVLGLWKAVGYPDLESFGRDLKLVAEAARDCPDRVFARDIRAEGWPDGTDRHRDIGTICRHDRWDVRLVTARAWDAAGRPSSVAPSRAPPANESLGAKMRRLGMLQDDDVQDAEFTLEDRWT